MAGELKIGIIGLDTSHVTAFTKLLNDPDHPYHVPGGKVVAAYPGGSPDVKLSYARIEGYTSELRDQYDVNIVNTPEAVAEQCDAILLESVDGRVHLQQFRSVAPFGKPVFIDKPFTVNYEEAKAIIELAGQYEIPLMSCSALRYAEGLTSVLKQTEKGAIIGADCYGPMAIEPTQPGLFWYGIHTAEMLFAILGADCLHVTAATNPDHDLVVGEWGDGRVGTIRGNRKGNNAFGALVHWEKGTDFVDVYSDPKPYYASLLEQVMSMFTTGKPPLDLQETLKIIRFIEAANESRKTGKTVAL
ncbi:Gfo/Idh/MocA family protein [Paenactinomyces guangxiensis]|uniref:Gfo/Idh/MocA family oxidoreductase n=1 Tax=Paenactinomyces guangxiensis TaxID=1490290 RepID=A0A7W2A902_9BACL|nr:Gfo/Idh/MocA family oxidoreductase [Paenactinomyces guangxiensis]MBA4494687.1 Gfo/Idh/MocA family oxidoreductase [Paenactinomyces guangxiensis]MBH8591771.1 Gfo/Idh/MocA family oxidoreductase [Paenactinomyces guangxiensis]